MQDHAADAAAAVAAPPPPPPSHHRRPRVREVSSRFMSPSVQRRPDPGADENSETPFPMLSQRKQHHHQHQQQQQRSAKHLRENNGHDVVPQPHPSKSCSGRIGGSASGSTPCVSRPGTPTPSASVYVSSRYRLTQQQHHSNHHHHRFVNNMASAAEKLMQASGLNQGKSSCDDSGVNCSVRSLPELGDRDRDVSNSIDSGNGGELKVRHPSPLSRSVSSEIKPPLGKPGGLSLPPVAPQCVRPGFDARKGKRGSSHQEDVHSLRLLYNRYLQWRFANAKARAAMKAQQKQALVCDVVVALEALDVFENPAPGPFWMGTIFGRQGIVIENKQEYRWRNVYLFLVLSDSLFEVIHSGCSFKALYSQSMKISEMRDSVNTKRIELQFLRGSKTLSTILEAQIPYLDEWSAMIEEYSVSITEIIQALVNASVQLPTGGNVRVDARELGEALDSAFKIMETMISNIQRFMPKTEETDTSISELARVAVGEKALIGECGDLLSKTYRLQFKGPSNPTAFDLP
ncbi:hypothetical protein Fmac_009395 [Flemingia macrophylla]|uniref:Protein ENDOSPERM DEFECTIVE 1 n=1 Tax=Flemingia macrophylla TaxID=520843 RepID=A0ABD1N055_9FABA